ncbi:general stress protein [Paenibacillus aurantius]|uniref:General stress protein n=1 Tax=Paenibacillus aurantius TaxID=2918900 RepID=A0AA96REU2_9BACL|nr:low temperature-induced protein [Paenibacillus aurantius]WNQ11247.1 general stress protein [Paenibacillus aurantius]
MDKKLVAIFKEEPEAVQAIERLTDEGIPAHNLSFLVREREEAADIRILTGVQEMDQVPPAAHKNGAVTGVSGFLTGLGALAVPGLGRLLAAGPFADALNEAAIADGTSPLVTALIEHGFQEDEARIYEAYVKDGHVVLIVQAPVDEAGKVLNVFRRSGAVAMERETV